MKVKFVWTAQNIPLMDNVLCQIACRLHIATHRRRGGGGGTTR